MEMVPADLATQITGKLTLPTVGIGAGPNCDAQVLVWQDMAGVSGGKPARFVKRFADIGGELGRAAVADGEEGARRGLPRRRTLLLKGRQGSPRRGNFPYFTAQRRQLCYTENSAENRCVTGW